MGRASSTPSLPLAFYLKLGVYVPHGQEKVGIFDIYNVRLLERSRVVFEGMLETYRWIVERYFPRLAPAMATWAMLPARVTGTLYYGRIAKIRWRAGRQS